MHFSTLASVAALAVFAPATVSAAGILGFALGTKKPDGSCKYTADYEADFDAIEGASGSKVVRGYSADDCNFAQQALPAAKSKGFQIVMGVWPDVEDAFSKDKAALQAYVTQYPEQVYAITVGSEALYRGNFTGAELLEKIKEVKDMFPEIKVGTADSWNKYADGTADDIVRGGVDILLVNAFAYWQAQDINNATATYYDDMMQAFARIQSTAGSVDAIELWNGETGWPSDGGDDYGAAVASTENAAIYYKSAVCSIVKWGVNVFVFEAFDEPWKPASIGEDGKAADETHWGVMTADRQPKYSLEC